MPLDVVHTVTGAMLMLNTDLHIADLVKRMSRPDFVRNALRAVQESLPTAARGSVSDLTASARSTNDRATFAQNPNGTNFNAKPSIQPRASRTLSSASQQDGDHSFSFTADHTAADGNGTGGFVYTKGWELEAENALKASNSHLL